MNKIAAPIQPGDDGLAILELLISEGLTVVRRWPKLGASHRGLTDLIMVLRWKLR